MKLNEEQQSVLNGSRGAVLAKYLSWLVQWGDAMGAQRLIPVTNVHALLTTPGGMLGDASAGTVESYFAEIREIGNYYTRCNTTTHISEIDFHHWRDQGGVTEEIYQFQKSIFEIGRRAGFQMTWTCTPYLVGNVPVKGEICAWTESSAVVYGNSVLGARTTRHGMDSSIAAALLGWVPEFGVLLDENRGGDFLVPVDIGLTASSDWSALGYYVGKRAGLRIPVFDVQQRPSAEEAKQLSAALASSGGVTMFHIIGVTPEAPTKEDAFLGRKPQYEEVFGQEQLQETYQSMDDYQEGAGSTALFLGCPFASLYELQQYGAMLRGRSLKPNMKLIVTTSFDTMKSAERLGIADEILSSGGEIRCDTCPMSGGYRHIPYQQIITNSFKCAHYCRAWFGAKTRVRSTEEGIDFVTQGGVRT